MIHSRILFTHSMLLPGNKFFPASGLNKLRLALRDHLRLRPAVRYNAALLLGSRIPVRIEQ